MKYLQTLILIILLAVFSSSQVVEGGYYPYHHNRHISNRKGHQLDSLDMGFYRNDFLEAFWFVKLGGYNDFYVPECGQSKQEIMEYYNIENEESLKRQLVADTTITQYYSYVNYLMREPVLTNYYLNKDVIRFSFYSNTVYGSPSKISFIHEDSDYYITQKVYSHVVTLPYAQELTTVDEVLHPERQTDSLFINHISKISKQTYDSLYTMIENAKITSLKPFLGHCNWKSDHENDFLIELSFEAGFYYIKRSEGQLDSTLNRIISYAKKTSSIFEMEQEKFLQLHPRSKKQ